ncbi:beta-hexosaminidase, partial [gut metagenome]
MKKLLTISFLFLFCFLAHAQGNLSALIPLPNHIEQVKKKAFKITEGKTTIVFEDKSLQFEAEQLAKIIKERMGVTLPVSQKAEKQSIVLKINPELKGKEHYTLEVAPKQMTLCGSTDAAVYWAIMTLDQILLGDVCN